MQVNGLFWNLGGADRAELVAEAAAELNVDLIVLAEPGNTELVSSAIQERVGARFHCPHSEVRRLFLLSRSADIGLAEVYGSATGRLTIRRLSIGGVGFLFAAVHLVSKRNWDPSSQQVEVQSLADEIRDVEKDQGHRRTILVGDLNMNPFEHGVVAAAGLHAMMTKADVVNGSRIVQNKEYPFFYNPMWGCFGDRTPGPPGSHYYRTGTQISYDWEMFDQLLIRPDALRFITEEVEILTRIGSLSLRTDRGRPSVTVTSDHFPLFFRFTSVSPIP